MRKIFALTMALCFGTALVLAGVDCGPQVPPQPPTTIVVTGDGASVDLCVASCANEAVWCPSTMTDAGTTGCINTCHLSASVHRSRNTEPAALACMASADSRAAFVLCGTLAGVCQ